MNVVVLHPIVEFEEDESGHNNDNDPYEGMYEHDVISHRMVNVIKLEVEIDKLRYSLICHRSKLILLNGLSLPYVAFYSTVGSSSLVNELKTAAT